MNILILNWRDPKNPHSGGAELVTLEHAKRWVLAGHTVTWFTCSFPGCLKEETIDGVQIIRQGSLFSVFLFAFFYYLGHNKRIDIVVDEIHGIPFFTPLYVRKPKIAFIHEVAAEIWDYMYPFPLSTIGKFIEPWYFKLYKHIPFWIVASSASEDLSRYGIDKRNCHIILNGITNPTLDKLPQKEHVHTYIFVSRLVKMKGIEEIIKAFGFIHLEDEKARLWIVGRGDKKYIESLHKMVEEYRIKDNVTFFGAVSEEKKLELLQKAHVILHASIKEGWGLVIIEAASQGTPAVVYKVAGLQDSVKNNETGIVLDENSPKEMAARALQLVANENLYQKFQKNCFQWAKSLRWDTAAKQSLALLEQTYKRKL